MMSQVVHLGRLYEAFHEKIQIYFIYIREAHLYSQNGTIQGEASTSRPPGEAKNGAIAIPEEERLNMARQLQSVGIRMPILMGDLEVENKYHAWPSRMVFVNRNGRILWSPGLNNGNTLDEAKLGTGESFYPIPAIREWLRGYLKGGRETRNVH